MLFFVAVGVPLAFPFSCSGFRVVVFIGLVVELVEGGGEDGVETIQDYVDVETIKIDYPLVDVLSSRKSWVKQSTDHRIFAANVSMIAILFL